MAKFADRLVISQLMVGLCPFWMRLEGSELCTPMFVFADDLSGADVAVGVGVVEGFGSSFWGERRLT